MLMLRANRKATHAVACFFYNHNRAAMQRRGTISQHRRYSIDESFNTRIVQPEYYNARLTAVCHRTDLTKVEIMCNHSPALGDGFIENLSVRQTVQPLVAQMDRVVSLLA